MGETCNTNGTNEKYVEHIYFGWKNWMEETTRRT